MERVSLLDIVSMHLEREQMIENQQREDLTNDMESFVPVYARKTSQIFSVIDPNPYVEKSGERKIVQIKILEVLYDEQVCNLVYM